MYTKVCHFYFECLRLEEEKTFFYSGGVSPSLPVEPNFFDEFVLIGRNVKHWQACNNALFGRNNEARTDELNPIMLK